MKPILQLALDFVDLKRALTCAEESVKGGIDWLEAGTPLIKSEGLNVVRELRRRFPKHTIIADLKTMDAGRIEMESAAKAGANIGIVMGSASESTINECIEAGKTYGIDICVDLLGVEDYIGLAKKAEQWGAHHVGLHLPIDDQMLGKDPLEQLRKLRKHINMPIAVAGGLNSETAPEAVKAGADIIIVGGAINKAPDAKKATEIIKKAMLTGKKIKSDLYKKYSMENVRELLMKVSTPNICDAMHYSGAIMGIHPVTAGAKVAGPAYTVRTYPGDWAKPVEAIEFAQKGDVLVIDAGGQAPAIWGELATHSCVQKGIAGVVIDGAIRDVPEIRALKYPAFSKIICPQAGEPKGFGETNIAIKIGGIDIRPGDWIVGDDNGVVRIPKDKVLEYANRAMDWLERENRLRKEIQNASSLSEVAELIKWEKKIGKEVNDKQ
ncbi:MAG: orotidine 5'-phosphate decarboxylase [Planctomycetes bacterium]|nr:orotidine 5'-phosphate decarboxylase [Planctomycetota bacterium]